MIQELGEGIQPQLAVTLSGQSNINEDLQWHNQEPNSHVGSNA